MQFCIIQRYDTFYLKEWCHIFLIGLFHLHQVMPNKQRRKLKTAPLIIQHDNHMSGIKGLSFQGIHIIQFILLEG